MASLSAPALDGTRLAADVADVIRAQYSHQPRTRQRAIGPSQIGTACDRQLTYQLLDMPSARVGTDPWASIVGTAVHAWLADAFAAENKRLGRLRYLVEVPVKVSDGMRGTCDLFDLDRSEVIDHKVLGVDSLRKIKQGNIPNKYRVQLHMYGYGFDLAGMPVETVSIAAYPRSGYLDGVKTWSEPYDPHVAIEALQRLGNLTTAAYRLQLDEADLWHFIEPTPGDECTWCPWWRPGMPVDRVGCPGKDTP